MATFVCTLSQTTLGKEIELLRVSDPLNRKCADCGKDNPEWANISLGVLLCIECCGVHRSLPCAIAKVKSLKLDRWSTDDVAAIASVGNGRATALYDTQIPKTHKRVSISTPLGIRKYLLKPKYDSKHRARLASSSSQTSAEWTAAASLREPIEKDGWLYKKGKDSQKWPKRWFTLRRGELKYFARQGDVPHAPKATLRLTETTPILRCDKTYRTRFGLQLACFKGVTTLDPDADETVENAEYEYRNVFLASDDGDELVAWLNAVRHNKAIELGLSPEMAEEGATMILKQLAWEALHDGFLWKTGPVLGSAFQRRWFSLFDGRLLYFKEPLDPAPRGVVELVACTITLLPKVVPEGHCFKLTTPDRTFNLKADTEPDAVGWVEFITRAIAIAVARQAKGPVSNKAAAVLDESSAAAAAAAAGDAATPMLVSPAPSCNFLAAMAGVPFG